MDVFLSTLLGGLLALSGALLGPLFQRKHDRWLAARADKERLRQKAEDLFDELDRVTSGSYASTMSLIKNIQDDSKEVVPVPDLGKIRAIAAVYFPTSQPIIDKYEKNRNHTGKVLMDHLKEKIKKGVIPPTEMKAMQVMLVTEHQKNAAEFVSEMRNHISQVVPRLT